jgi:hypothetical protein
LIYQLKNTFLFLKPLFMKLQKFFKLAIFAVALMSFGAACVKEGPPGKDGSNGAVGAAGKNGTDANETCKMCHNPTKVDAIAFQFQLSKHEYGIAAEEEAGSNTCGPCHLQESFRDVVKRNVPATFTLNATTGKYVNDYMSTTSTAYGAIGCRACHSSIHETYNSTDLPKLTTVAPVPMSMWGGKKTINITPHNGTSNLCIKCHQPRPFTFNNTRNPAYTGNVLDYAALASKPNDIFFDYASLTTAQIIPGYRTHTHYGTVGAMYAGMGGVEFAGPTGYANMKHKDVASCGDCHMSAMTGKAGGHSFVAKGNFTGCNVTGCHATTPVNAANAKYWTNPRAEIKLLLEQLAAKLVVTDGGVTAQILNKNPDTEANLWVGITAGKYDGYLNVYDPITNPLGVANNGVVCQNASPSSSWDATQKAYNLTLPKIKLTNAQMGAIINFQMCLREYSLGIHNLDYSRALLKNSIAVLN